MLMVDLLGGHVGDRGAVGHGELGDAGAVEFDELVDNADLAELSVMWSTRSVAVAPRELTR